MSVPDNVEDQLCEPDLHEAMRRAFQMVCDTPGFHNMADSLMEIVSSSIVELVKAGEVDPERLCCEVMRALNGRKTKR